MNQILSVVVLECIISTICISPPSPSTCGKALKLLKPFHHKKISCKKVGGMPVIKYKTSLPSSNLSCDTIPGKMQALGYNVSDCLYVGKGCRDAYFRIDQIADWEESWVACHAIEGGNMATVRNFAELMAVRELSYYLPEYPSTWLGAAEIKTEGVWRWSDNGDIAKYFKWGPGEPDGVEPGLNCIRSGSVDNNFQWDDENCAGHVQPLCKVPTADPGQSGQYS